MFYDLKNFPFLKCLVDNVELYSNEYLALRDSSMYMKEFLDCPPERTPDETPSHLTYWALENGLKPEQTGYDLRNGEWTAFPIYKDGFPVKWYDACSAIPKTYDKVLKIPGIYFAAYFRLAPGAGTKDHSHTQSHLVFHLLLEDLKDGVSVMRCGNEERILAKKGDWCLFDYSVRHSSDNFAKSDRVNLAIDFRITK
ncbi:MAG TPA: hypothetical protein DIS94_09165 [Bacteroidetes bacterium]|uniref:aspartyl/asparaginyl beta-hydroxylase domain-containing protein n=1 Tax=uncultured Flavobacterium sp. TaxID=165435 RepID=UPI000EC95C59|nr:aspartyl/asparaginyl beta-hydroxylase domain-containing protein [uncultured Flavobacterium sp.]HCN37867.1 hypothetical protein [Bacteroidota bacterium]HRE73240.1 aspartyl/asparaginyl beta-hydroxylase domain-containing protein [Flavobacteriales bacterium]